LWERHTLAEFSGLSDIYNGGAGVTGLSEDPTLLDTYDTGNKGLNWVLPASTQTLKPASVLAQPMDVRDGYVRLRYRAVAYAGASTGNVTMDMRLYSAGTLASPGVGYHRANVSYFMISKLSLGSSTNLHTGAWQWGWIPIHLFSAVNGGADLSAIIFPTLVGQRSANAPVLGIGKIDFTPYILDRPATGARADDASPSFHTVIRPMIEAAGGRGMFNGGAALDASAGYGRPGRATWAQYADSAAAGHQGFSQAGTTEAVATSLAAAQANYQAEQDGIKAQGINIQGLGDGSYHSGEGYGCSYDRYGRYTVGLRTVQRADFGQAAFPQWNVPQVWPPADPYNIQVHDMAGVGGPGGTTTHDGVIAQYNAHKACRGLNNTNKFGGYYVVMGHDSYLQSAGQTGYDGIKTLCDLKTGGEDMDIIPIMNLINPWIPILGQDLKMPDRVAITYQP
jgi:hypothetical protein